MNGNEVPGAGLPPAKKGRALLLVPPLAAVLLLLCFPPGERWGAGLPPGDVAIDAATAESLARGQGFWTPWERGSAFRPPPSRSGKSRFGHPADQHPPLWPLAGAALARALGLAPYPALRWASFLAHIVLLLLVTAAARRMIPGPRAVLPGLFYALSSLGAAFSFNGSLYAAQAALTLAAALLAARRRGGVKEGLLLGLACGAAWLLNYQAALLVPACLAIRFLPFRREARETGGRAGPWTAAFAAGLLAAAAPWLARNLSCFGNPLWSVNTYYLAAKAGARFHHVPADGVLLLRLVPPSPGTLARNLALWSAQNLSFLFLLLLAAAPGALAVVLLCRPGGRPEDRCGGEEEGRETARALAVILAFHLAACLLWPALKTRYLVPALPLLLLLAFHALRASPAAPPRRAAAVTALAGLFCAGVWLKGGTHGTELGSAFLLSFLPMAPLLILAGRRAGAGGLFRRLPLPALCLLLLSGAGIRPGGAYFNLPPWTDFFGADKDALEAAAGRELLEGAERLARLGAVRVMGDPRLHFAGRAFQVVTPPLRLPGEAYDGILLRAARLHGVRRALLSAEAAGALSGKEGIRKLWSGRRWVLFHLLPEGE